MRGYSSLGYSDNNNAHRSKSDTKSESETGSDELTIGEMSRLFQVSMRTIRFYEDRGLIAPRREGHSRIYGDADRARMEIDSAGQEAWLHLDRNHFSDRQGDE